MNKPVAWIKQGRLGFPVLEFDTPFRYESYSVKNPPIPLYTHPANTCKHGVDDGACKECYLEVTHPVKELTDEEIEELIWNTTDMKDFAKAILRKAQEK